jgi:hypothetical protein
VGDNSKACRRVTEALAALGEGFGYKRNAKDLAFRELVFHT